MDMLLYIFGAAVAVGATLLLSRTAGKAYLRYRGQRVITCPENHQPAAVEVNAGRAVVSSVTGKLELRLSDCSRWPERAGCGQECLSQIQSSPEECLVRNMFRKWYHEKSCVVCGKALGNEDWLEHQPTLMDPARVTMELRTIPAEKIPEVLSNYQPVCWNCHVAESFRREHPELVTDRDWQAQGNRTVH